MRSIAFRRKGARRDPREAHCQRAKNCTQWTALSALLVAVVLVRSGLTGHAALETVAGVCLAAAAALTAAGAPRRGTAAARRRLLGVAVSTALAGILVVVQIFMMR